MQQLHVIFRGMVQGVGFRYTTRRYALKNNLQGWVKNLPDGSVEMIAQGDITNLKALLKDLDQHFEGYIKSKDVEKSEIDQNIYNSFSISY